MAKPMRTIGNMVWKNVAQTLAAVLFLVFLWVVAHALVGNELLLPNFLDCLKEAFHLFGEKGFWQSFFSSLSRVCISFVCSFTLALFFAVIAYMVPSFCRFFSVMVSVLRSLPTLAAMLIILVWTGAGNAPIVVAFLSLFPMLFTGILSALKEVNEDLLVMSRLYRVPMKKRIFQLYLPSAAPYVLRESGAAFSFSVKLVLSAEILANTARSLGGMMQQAKLYYEMPTLFALVMVTFLTGLLLESLGEWCAKAVERRVR